MAVQYLGSGGTLSGVRTMYVPLPPLWEPGDLLLLRVETAGENHHHPAEWNAHPFSPFGTGGPGCKRLYLFWRIAGEVEGDVFLPNDFIDRTCKVLGFRGVNQDSPFRTDGVPRSTDMPYMEVLFDESPRESGRSMARMMTHIVSGDSVGGFVQYQSSGRLQSSGSSSCFKTKQSASHTSPISGGGVFSGSGLSEYLHPFIASYTGSYGLQSSSSAATGRTVVRESSGMSRFSGHSPYGLWSAAEQNVGVYLGDGGLVSGGTFRLNLFSYLPRKGEIQAKFKGSSPSFKNSKERPSARFRGTSPSVRFLPSKFGGGRGVFGGSSVVSADGLKSRKKEAGSSGGFRSKKSMSLYSLNPFVKGHPVPSGGLKASGSGVASYRERSGLYSSGSALVGWSITRRPVGGASFGGKSFYGIIHYVNPSLYGNTSYTTTGRLEDIWE